MKASAGKREPIIHPGLKHPGRWLWLLVLVPALIGLSRLRFDVEVFDLLPDSLPAVEGLKLYQRHFANARELILTVQATGSEQAEMAARAIAERLRQSAALVDVVTWQPPWLEHPEQAAELVAYLWLNQPPEVFRELTNRLAPDRLVPALEATRQELATSMSPQEIGRLSYDPFGLTKLPDSMGAAMPGFGQGQELFSSAEGTFRILFVQARGELRNYRECARWLAAVRNITGATIAERPDSAGITIGYTGSPAFVAEIATGMELDMTKSVGGTALIIAVLFWLAHRRVKPMLWLLTLLALVLGTTLALGGLIFGTINVVSIGFAAILLGLAVDYAVVHYQEALAHPDLSIPQIRHAIAPSIFWAALTTIAAFLVLNFGGLPGLGQLGNLVGLGVAIAALIMIFEFLPPLFPGRNHPTPTPTKGLLEENLHANHEARRRKAPVRRLMVYAVTAGIVLVAGAILVSGLPRIDPSAAPLRPRQSAAYDAVEQIKIHLNQKREPLWLILGGNTVAAVADRLDEAQGVLARAQSAGLIAGYSLPTTLWPREKNQAANREAARYLSTQGPALRQAALSNGFAERSLVLTEGILNTWQSAGGSPGVFWPTNPMSRWIFEKITARTPTNHFALGMLTPYATNTSAALAAKLKQVRAEFPREQVWLSGWELLGSSIFGRVKANLWKVLLPMFFLVVLSLYLAFRRASEICLSLAVLGLSGLFLLSVMRLAGWSWNLLNLMAIPLVLGTGVDYSIFMQLALRRHDGDLRAAYASVGRALLLCGGTAIAGFGSLAWSTNAGMASLGQVCAVGVGSNMLIAVYLLPAWWSCLTCKRTDRPTPQGTMPPVSKPAAPSSFYRPELWRFGLALVRILPAWAVSWLSHLFANVYWLLARHRRDVVIQNLAPALDGQSASVRRTAKALFHQFARKVIDLWRYEAGLDIDGLFGGATGWEHFEAAQAQKRGVLVLTPHLGNWEFGGPMLTRRGVSLQVITMAEPGGDFTQLRQASRARWQIETLVIGDNPLAFVEIIKRLEAGATVALLIDRPPPASAVTVELFGRPFPASIAAAELARASGCVLLPVYLPWEADGYEAHMLPAIPYDRAALRDRGARRQLTQQIVHTFEPLIRRHLDQWYHFVPVWPQ